MYLYQHSRTRRTGGRKDNGTLVFYSLLGIFKGDKFLINFACSILYLSVIEYFSE